MSGLLRVLREYAARVRAFQPNARLYLINMVIAGAAMGIFRLLFNFFVLSLGYDEALVGRLVTINSLTSLFAALPAGFLGDRLGRKAALILAGASSALSVIFMVLQPGIVPLYAANIIFGISQSLAAVTIGPFLMENSGEQERTYLFSFNAGLQMVSVSVGNWVGGYLPGWIATFALVGPESSTAYGWALLIAALAEAASILPLIWLRSPSLDAGERSVFAPLDYAAKNPGSLSRLVLPLLITSIGAGLIMPFINVFYRVQYGQPDPVIGALFAWGSLAMGIGLLLAPPLADRMGKIQFVVVTQAISIPLLVVMGFAPWFWLSASAYYVRLALMNMSSPVYQTFVMEQVEPSARATVTSLISMAWNFGWSFSPMISGWLQVRSGFGLPFIGTIALYSISVWMYWAYFWRSDPAPHPVKVAGD